MPNPSQRLIVMGQEAARTRCNKGNSNSLLKSFSPLYNKGCATLNRLGFPSLEIFTGQGTEQPDLSCYGFEQESGPDDNQRFSPTYIVPWPGLRDWMTISNHGARCAPGMHFHVQFCLKAILFMHVRVLHCAKQTRKKKK